MPDVLRRTTLYRERRGRCSSSSPDFLLRRFRLLNTALCTAAMTRSFCLLLVRRMLLLLSGVVISLSFQSASGFTFGARLRTPVLLKRQRWTVLASPSSGTLSGEALSVDTRESDEDFDWWRQWYPVALERDLDGSSPHKVTLLGRDLVIWKDGNEKKWRCFIDRCPHRLAPLSEGRIEPRTGHLQCAYHGWEFNEEGACTTIPQMDPEAPAAARESRRACATPLPAMAAQGMVWVWPDGSPDGVAASRHAKPNLMDDVDERSMSYLVVCRDMPYGVDTLLENGIDPSHLPWAHHGIISHRNQAAHIDIKVDNITKAGFDSHEFHPKKPSTGRRRPMEMAGAKNTTKPTITVPQSLHFRPPNLLYQVINVTQVLNMIPFLPKKERVIRIVTYAVPTAPGKSRVIYRFLRNYFLPPVPLLRWPPQWIEHLRIMRVLDSDTVFLHGQERELQLARDAGVTDVDKAYYMPTPADGSVRALRKWFARFGGPKWLVPGMDNRLPPAETSREVLLDRYHSHVKNCKVCRGALTNIRRLRQLIGFLSVMAFYLGLLGQSIYTRLSGGFLTVLGITGVVLIKEYERLFVYTPWSHAKN